MENKDSCPIEDKAVVTPESIPETDKVKENEVPDIIKPTVAASNGPTKSRHREEKSRKKDDKSVDHVLKALNSLESTEEKLAAMCKKYADIFDEHRKLQMVLKQTEKRCSGLQREKEQLQTEHSKAILTRSRLENLCRELQRQNKAIKDENLLKIREEEEKRKEVSAKFQNTLSEITALMQQNNDKNMKLRDDNIDMTTKLKNVCEQYELREQQVEKIAKQMQLESQLADAKLAKLKMEMAAEKEILLREKQQLLMELTQYQARCQEAQATEVSLRNQISLYNDKYDEFQVALERSNNVFGGFKGEMEKMSKKICKLEKETSSWKQRWERSHGALLEMAADKQKSEQELSVAARQLAALQNLCRTLQTERTQLLSKIKTFESTQAPPQVEKPVKDESTALDVAQDTDQSKKVAENEEIVQNQVQDINGDVSKKQELPTAVPVSSSVTTNDSNIQALEPVENKISNPTDLHPVENTTVLEPVVNTNSNITLEPVENKNPLLNVIEPVENTNSNPVILNPIENINSNSEVPEPVESTSNIVPPCHKGESPTPSVNSSSNADNCTTLVQSSSEKSELSSPNSIEVPLSNVCQNGTEENSDESNSAESLMQKDTGEVSNSVKGKVSSKKKRK